MMYSTNILLNLISTIFRTIETDAISLNKNIGLLGKSFHDIKKDFSNGLGVRASLFSTSISNTDLQNLQKFNSAIKVTDDGLTKSQRISKAWSENMTGCSMAAKRAGNDLITGEKSIKDISTEMQDGSKSAVGFTAKMVAMNVGISLLISGIFKLSSYLVDNLVHSLEKAEEKSASFAGAINESVNDMSTNTKTLSDINAEYQELSKGVNTLGENVSLSTTQYSRYKEIISQVSDIMPNLTTYFNAQGEKIAFAKGNLVDLNKEYEKYIQSQARAFLSEGDEEGNTFQDVLDDYKNNEKHGFWASLWRKIKGQTWGLDISDIPQKEAIAELKKLENKSQKEVSDILDSGDTAYTSDTGRTTKSDQIKAAIRAAIGANGSKSIAQMTEAEFNVIQQQIMAQIESLESSIDVDMSKITGGLLQTAYSKDAFWKITDTDVRNDITTFLSSISNEVWDKLGVETANDVSVFVEDIINSMSSNKEGFADAWNGLFSLEEQDLPVDEFVSKVNSFIDVIAKALGLDEEGKKELLISLGFDIEGLQSQYNSAISKFGEGSKGDLKAFFEKNSINTQEEVDKWNEITKGTNNATEAMEKYVQSSTSLNEMNISLTEMKTASDSISALSDAFKQLSDDGYMSTESMSKIQEATKLSGDEWDKYQNKLMNAKAGSAEFNQVMSELTYKTLENQMTVEELASADEAYVARILEENGVANANAVAHGAVTKAKVQTTLSTIDLTDATGESIEEAFKEINAMELVGVAVGDLQSAYIEAQSAMTSAVSQSVLDRLGLMKEEVVAIESIADAYSSIGTSRKRQAEQSDPYGLPLQTPQEKRYEQYQKYGMMSALSSDEQLLINVGAAKEKIQDIIDSIGIGGVTYSPSSGGSSSSDKNEALDNYLKYAESIYKVHQDESKYINDLQWGLNNLAKTDEERLEIAEKIEEARRDYADNRIKDLEHENELLEQAGGTEEQRIVNLQEMQRIRNEEANRYRTWMREQLLGMGYTDEAEISRLIENSDFIQEMQKGWWGDQDKILDIYDTLANTAIDDIEHQIELNTNNHGEDFNNNAYYKQIQDIAHAEAERLRALDPEKYKEQIQEWQNVWWDAQHKMEDWLDDMFSKVTDFASSYFDSQKKLLQSYYDVTNAVAEEQHEINKELEASMTMYEYLDEETRKLLFNQEDYNKLSAELVAIQEEADRLQRSYQKALDGATLNTIEEITSNYEMQYDLMMKNYEIAKADLEVAKKKQKLNNVLNERNVRMFIDGQWKWVANTQDVIDAKSELADAEYASRTAEATKTQTESINALTKQIDELGTIVNKFEDGAIDLDDAIGNVALMFNDLPAIIEEALSEASSSKKKKQNSSSGAYGASYGSHEGIYGTGYASTATRPDGTTVAVYIDGNGETQTDLPIGSIVHTNDGKSYKITGGSAGNYKSDPVSSSGAGGSSSSGHTSITTKSSSDNTPRVSTATTANGKTYPAGTPKWIINAGYASGTRSTTSGTVALGEVEPEIFIDSHGHLIPINQPTVGNIDAGGIVFNQEQMDGARAIWDMVNSGMTNLNSIPFKALTQSIDNSNCNNVIINGMTVDNNSADGQALINALRRYVGNH